MPSALTTEMPTPWRPPDTLYPSPPNLPPACSTVSTTSAAVRFILGVLSDRNTTAVVADLDAAVGKNRDVNPAAVAGHRLVDGVVDLPKQGGADPSGQSSRCTYPGVCGRLRAFENGDVSALHDDGSVVVKGDSGQLRTKRPQTCRGGFSSLSPLTPTSKLVVASEIQSLRVARAITSRWSRGLNTVLILPVTRV